jgi:hypothetical protein
MTRLRHAKTGIGALIVYAALLVVTAFVLYELGSEPLGYSSLASRFLPPSEEQTAEARRFGKMRVRADQFGHCREYSVDNRTQELVQSGTVVCDREQYARTRQRTKADVIREAFGGSN